MKQLLSLNNTKPNVQFITDIEGSLTFFQKVIAHSDVLSISLKKNNFYQLEFKRPNVDYLVCGGDIGDRGDPLFGGGDIRIARALIDLKQRYRDNVILLIGNRDANKMRFANELPLDPHDPMVFDVDSKPEYPSGLTYGQFLEKLLQGDKHSAYKNINNPITRLQWILQYTMGAPDSFKYRSQELAILNPNDKITDFAVYDSFRQSVMPGEHGFMYQYLQLGEIAWLHHRVLYTHGGILDHTIGQVPDNSEPTNNNPIQTNCAQWVAQLNAWKKSAFEKWEESCGIKKVSTQEEQSVHTTQTTLCDYATGRCHDKDGKSLSIITAKLIDPQSGVMNPLSDTVATFLTNNRVALLVTGHQPHGDTPCFVQGTAGGQPIGYLDGDTLYSHYRAYDSDLNTAQTIRAENPRGDAYSVITLRNNDPNGFCLSIHGVDGMGIEYQHPILFNVNSDGASMTDSHIGRKISINGKDYLVRMNAPTRAALQSNLHYNAWLPFVEQQSTKRYTLSTVDKPFSIRYQPIDQPVLQQCQPAKLWSNQMSARFFQQACITRSLQDVKLIIFDIDLTVIDNTTQHYWKHLNHARRQCSQLQLPVWSNDEFKHYFEETKGWISREHIVSRMLATYVLDDPRVKDACEFFYKSFESDFYLNADNEDDKDKAPKLFDHVALLLATLQNSDIPLLALSDTETRLINFMLNHHDVHHHFVEIIGEANKSHSTQKFDNFMQRQQFRFGDRGKHLLVIGDSLSSDGKLAQQLNARFIFFIGDKEREKIAKKNSAFQQALLSGAIPKDSTVITSHKQLLDVVQSLNTQQKTLCTNP